MANRSGELLARYYCGRLYKQYPMYAGDQSKCELCKSEENKEYRDQKLKEIDNDFK